MKLCCPACGLRMVTSINTDAAICPDHGAVSGLQLLQSRGKVGFEALIDMRADQLHSAFGSVFAQVRGELRL